MPTDHGLTNDTYTQLRNEFVDWITGELDSLEQIVEAISNPYNKDTTRTEDKDEEDIVNLMRVVHNIKGAGGAFGFNTISTVAHRFEDFLSVSMSQIKEEGYHKATLRFVDLMRALVELGDEPKIEIAKAMLRSLPVASEIEQGDSVKNTKEPATPVIRKETLVVSPSKTLSAIVRKVSENLGHRVVGAKNGIDGLRLAINMHPDYVIMSTVMNGVTGPDLSRALSAMHATKNIKLILISNLDLDHPDLSGVPKEVDIIHQSGNFPITLFKHMQQINV